MNIDLVKIQYEILNIPLATLADDIAIPLSVLENEAKKHGWIQWWPNTATETCKPLNPNELDESMDLLETQADQYLVSNKKRLAVYSLAKEIILAKKYAQLEGAILDKASALIDCMSNETSQTKVLETLTNIHKSLTVKSYAVALQSMDLNRDDLGLPTVIIKDLSGDGRGKV